MSRFGRLFGGPRDKPGPTLPPGYRLYAVGDVHGRDDLLGDLLAQIEADAAERGRARLAVVFLGDLIDRGPSSRQVVERLRTYRPAGVRPVFLAGNHEEVLLRILDGEARLIPDWLRFGGAECLASYGVDAVELRRLPPTQAIDTVRSAIPASHGEFLRGFDDTFRAGSYLFVHAGIRPGIPLDQQSRTDLRWIREPFLTDGSEHGFTVIHGHTIREQVEERANRIGIDTGAYRSGILTALGLEGSERWYLQARAPDIANMTPEWNRASSSELDAVSSQSG
jgi:serine/threonine protein phosphatase 1